MKEEELFGDRTRNITRLLHLISLGYERVFFDFVCLYICYQTILASCQRAYFIAYLSFPSDFTDQPLRHGKVFYLDLGVKHCR